MIDISTGKPMTRPTRRECVKGLAGLAGILASGVAPAAVVRSMLGARGVAMGDKKKLPYEAYAGFSTGDMISLVDNYDFGSTSGKLKDLSANGIDLTSDGAEVDDDALIATGVGGAWRILTKDIYDCVTTGSGMTLSCFADFTNTTSSIGALFGAIIFRPGCCVLEQWGGLTISPFSDAAYWRYTTIGRHTVHAVVDLELSEGRIYFDGVKLGESVPGISYIGLDYNDYTNGLRIFGSGRGVNGEYLQPSYGTRIYSFRAVNRLLSDAEIQSDSNIDHSRFNIT